MFGFRNKNDSEWTRRFAWLPVKLKEDGSRVWLKFVYHKAVVRPFGMEMIKLMFDGINKDNARCDPADKS